MSLVVAANHLHSSSGEHLDENGARDGEPAATLSMSSDSQSTDEAASRVRPRDVAHAPLSSESDEEEDEWPESSRRRRRRRLGCTDDNVSWRVKVYRLNEEGQWDDRGTGRARICVEPRGSKSILVEREENAECILIRSLVSSSTKSYQKQGDNIITWDSSQLDSGEALLDVGKSCLALSFQEREGCDRVWDDLLLAQAALAKQDALRHQQPMLDDDAADCGPSAGQHSCHAAKQQQSRVFLSHVLGARGGELGDALAAAEAAAAEESSASWPPLPQPTSVSAVRDWVLCLARAVTCAAGKLYYARQLLESDGYLLRDLFVSFVSDSEDLDNVEALRTCADAAKLVMLLNEPPLVEGVLQDAAVYEGILGALEYAADFKKRANGAKQDNPPPSPLSDASSSPSRGLLPASTAPADAVETPLSLSSMPPICKRESLPETPTEMAVTAREASRVPLRRLVLQQATMREVVPITDETLRARISLHFRATVLRDALARPGMDEAQLSALHAVIFFNTNDILRRLHFETDYLARVIDALRSPTPNTMRQALKFLTEMTALARGAQMVIRDALYQYAVTQANLYGALTDVLAGNDTKPVKTACVEVITAVLRVDPSSFRRRALRESSHPRAPAWISAAASAELSSATTDPEECNVTQPVSPETSHESLDLVSGGGGGQELSPADNNEEKPRTLLYWLVRLCADADDDVCMRAAGAVRLCTEVETMDEAEREAFLGLLYEEHYIGWLAAPLFEEEMSDEKRPTSKIQVCDLLTYCVRTHAYRIKYFLLRHNVVSRIVALASSPNRCAQLAAVRFVRGCVGAKDDFFTRYLLKNSALSPILSLIATTKDSLVTSAVAELCEFIRVENIKPLVDHLARTQAEKLGKSSIHAHILDGLRTRLAQNEEAAERASRNDTVSMLSLARRERIQDRDEAYFEEDDDDDDEDEPSPNEASSKMQSLGSKDDDDDGFRPRLALKSRQSDAKLDSDNNSDDEGKRFGAGYIRRRTLRKGNPLRFAIKLSQPSPAAAQPVDSMDEQRPPLHYAEHVAPTPST